MKRVLFCGNTDVGSKRKDNQDTFLACEISFMGGDAVLLAVIDGVGGCPGGDIAANIAADQIKMYLDGYNLPSGNGLEQALIVANNRIVNMAHKNTDCYYVGYCVATACVVDQYNVLHYAHLGDTRLYLYRNNQLIKISHDHSIVGYMEEVGILSETDAMNHSDRNKINRMLGAELHRRDNNFIESGSLPLEGECQILLCSDGLTDQVKSAEIEFILRKDIPLEDKVDTLIAEANSKGGKDNVTVVISKIMA